MNMQTHRPPFNAVKAIQLALSLMLVSLALTLFNPAATFPSCGNYRLFAALGTENHWGIGFGLVGILGLLGLPNQRIYLRASGVLLVATTYALIAGFFGLSNPVGWGWSSLAILAGLAYYLAYRLIRP